MNITLSVNEETLRRARLVAQGMGKSVNQLVRDYLEHLAGSESVEAELAEFRELSQGSGGRSRGRRFSRDELHERG